MTPPEGKAERTVLFAASYRGAMTKFRSLRWAAALAALAGRAARGAAARAAPAPAVSSRIPGRGAGRAGHLVRVPSSRPTATTSRPASPARTRNGSPCGICARRPTRAAAAPSNRAISTCAGCAGRAPTGCCSASRCHATPMLGSEVPSRAPSFDRPRHLAHDAARTAATASSATTSSSSIPMVAYALISSQPTATDYPNVRRLDLTTGRATMVQRRSPASGAGSRTRRASCGPASTIATTVSGSSTGPAPGAGSAPDRYAPLPAGWQRDRHDPLLFRRRSGRRRHQCRHRPVRGL